MRKTYAAHFFRLLRRASARFSTFTPQSRQHDGDADALIFDRSLFHFPHAFVHIIGAAPVPYFRAKAALFPGPPRAGLAAARYYSAKLRMADTTPTDEDRRRISRRAGVTRYFSMGGRRIFRQQQPQDADADRPCRHSRRLARHRLREHTLL